MGYATIEDYDDAIEAVIFPAVWEKAKPLLDRPDALVCIRGRIQANEKDVRILAEEILPLGQAGQTVRYPVSEVHLYVDRRHESQDVVDGLTRILAAHHGETPVFLHIESSRQEIAMNPEYYLDYTEEAEQALKQLLGARAVDGRR